MAESELYNKIIGAYSHGDTRLFRQQSILAWSGKIISRDAHSVTLAHPHAIKIGAPGMPDLGGFTSIVITPEMIGHRLAVAIQIEVKGPRIRITPEQENFLEMASRLGVRAGIARNQNEARCIIYHETLISTKPVRPID
jgi:hypothetical protein